MKSLLTLTFLFVVSLVSSYGQIGPKPKSYQVILSSEQAELSQIAQKQISNGDVSYCTSGDRPPSDVAYRVDIYFNSNSTVGITVVVFNNKKEIIGNVQYKATKVEDHYDLSGQIVETRKGASEEEKSLVKSYSFLNKMTLTPQ